MTILSVGSVIKRTFSIWAKNLVPFTVLTAMVYSPVLIYVAVFLSGDITLRGLTTFSYVVYAGGFILSVIVTGAITYGVFEQMRGRHAPLGQCLSVGISRMLPILGTGLLVGLVVALGLIALIIPGIILMCMFWLAVPVTVVERVGVTDSMRRSKNLTDGVKTTIFGILFVLGLIEQVVYLILDGVLLGDTATVGDVKVYLLVVTIVSLFAMSLRSVANAVAYHDVRTVKEGIGIEELLSVFE